MVAMAGTSFGVTFPRVAFAAILGFVLSVSCTSSSAEDLPPIHLQVVRGEIILRDGPKDTFQSQQLRAFFYDCIYQGDSVPEATYQEDLATLRGDSLFRWLIDTTLKIFPPEYPFEQKLRPLFQRWKKIYPQDSLPTLVTFVTGYGRIGALTLETDQAQLCDKHLMIGLNYYLSDTFGFYPPDLPYFIRRRLTPPHLPVFVALRLIRSKMPKLSPYQVPKMIDYMVWYGIQLYALEKLLPEVPDTLRFFYTQSHMEWLKENKRYAYKALLPYFQESRYLEIQPFIGEEPFTKLFGRESPPRLGWYFGYEAVRQYMERYSDMTLRQLLELPPTEYQKLFEKARYRP